MCPQYGCNWAARAVVLGEPAPETRSTLTLKPLSTLNPTYMCS